MSNKSTWVDLVDLSRKSSYFRRSIINAAKPAALISLAHDSLKTTEARINSFSDLLSIISENSPSDFTVPINVIYALEGFENDMEGVREILRATRKKIIINKDVIDEGVAS